MGMRIGIVTGWAVKLAIMREAAVQIVRTLRRAGHESYLAGGCVRDRLLGLEPKDHDVATSAPPEVVRKLFRNSRYVGESFGVVLVRVRQDAVEVATFRSEWGYHDGRRPDHVIFTDAEHDAQRRDFTINGLFEDPLEDRVIDYVGGQADLKAGVIRAIGDPQQRFAEDYLRMLRAVRFAARFHFTLEPATASAIRTNAPKLEQISRERIGMEMRLMLSAAVVKLLSQLHLDGPTLNEDCRAQPTLLIDKLDADADYPTKLAAWSLDRGSDLLRWRRALNLSNDEYEAARDSLSVLETSRQWPNMNIAQRKRLLAAECWSRASLLLQALDAGLSQQLRKEAEPLLAQGVAPLPLLTGDDLVAMGMRPGPGVGKLLHEAYDEQLSGRLTDQAQARQWARQRMDEPD
ncbi:MAG: CCA tRNA nucleotidyltransferase [Phycisphaeraceae bacterium]|nr:CCA tRNA nucleotidyltransferase [Phycisphaeraceae bacterium]